MLSKKLSLTFGPEKELKEIIAAHPERKFKLFHAADDNSEFMLMDCSGKESMFHSGLDYYICGEINPNENSTNGYIECRYVTLNEDEQKVFKSIFKSWDAEAKRPVGLDSSVLVHSLKDNFEFLLINQWEDENVFMVWDNDKDNQMNQFGHDGNSTPVVKTYREIG